MVFQTSTRAPHPFFTASPGATAWYTFIVALIFSGSHMHGQEISGLEVARSIEHVNYSISALDVHFVDGHQLIAYSNSSGFNKGDTLVIYDFAQNEVLSEIPGVNWSYEIYFVDENQLLFHNTDKLYRVVNFNSPMITEIASGVIAFALSDNGQTVALLKDNGNAYDVEVSSYNSNTGVLSPLDIYEVTDEIQSTVSKLSFSPDGTYIAINGGYESDYVIIVNTNNGDVETITTPDNQGTYSPVFYHQGSNLHLAVGGGYQNGSIELIDVDALQLETTIPVFPNYNYALGFDPSQEYVVTGGFNGIIKIFHVNETDYDEVAMTPSLIVNQLQFTQDNMYIVSGEGPSYARLVIYRILRGPSSVSETNSQNYKIYPNPTEDLLYMENAEGALISIQNVSGQHIMDEQMYSSQLDVSRLESGLYVVRCLKDGVVDAMKFFKS